MSNSNPHTNTATSPAAVSTAAGNIVPDADTQVFSVEIADEHPIPVFHSGGDTFFPDLGCPFTFAAKRQCSFMGETHRDLSDRMGPQVIGENKNGIGVDFNVLLGTDVLSQFALLFDYANKQLVVSRNKLSLQGDNVFEVSLKRTKPVVIELEYAGRPVPVVLDTGAPMAFFPKKITDAYPKSGRSWNDYSPMFGSWTTPVRKIPFSLCGYSLEIECGNTPTYDDCKNLAPVGATGIIGFALFSKFKVLLDFPRKKMFCQEC
jgi:hypothetical protein